MTQDHATEAPVCYRHPDRHTLLECSRCDRPICASCSIDASVGQRCPECVSTEGVQRTIKAGRTGSRSSGAPATMTFIALAVGFFLLTGLGRQLNGPIGTALAHFNLAIAAGEWWRLFTPVLLHASITHILFNMWALWVLGPQIERGVGTLPFVSLYLASAAAGGAFTFVLGEPQTIAVGASGAIFGLFGVWANMAVHRRRTMYGQALLRQIGFLLLINAAIPLFVPSIAWEAHLGGLVAGFLIGEAWARSKGPRAGTFRALAGAVVAAMAVLTVLL